MQTVQDLTLQIIRDFVSNNFLFTALDISNTVKQTMPYERHKIIREIVRNAFHTEIESFGYDRTPITVSLTDGTAAEALLYHPLSATWDLDNLYDTQQRTATSSITAVPTIVSTVSGSFSKDDDGTVNITTAPINPLPVNAPVDLWSQLWQTSPSLFPRK